MSPAPARAHSEQDRLWVFVRHGQSVANAQGWLSGLVDTPLTELGRAQAAQVGEQLEADFGCCLSSDLSRAHDTARIALGGRLPVRTFSQLRERSMGDWARRPKAPLRASGAFAAMRTWTGAPPQGESYRDLSRRLLPFLAALELPEGPVLVVAHGGVLRVLLAHIDGVLGDQVGALKVPNAQPVARALPIGYWQQQRPR